MFEDDYDQEVLLVPSAGLYCRVYNKDEWDQLSLMQLPAIMEAATIGEIRRIDHLFSRIAASPSREAAVQIWNLAYGSHLIYFSRAATPRSQDDRTSLDPYLFISVLNKN